jgi:hypothetical protein
MRLLTNGVFLACLAAVLTGCFKWPEQHVSPASAVEGGPQWTRIIRHDSSEVELYRAAVQGDSLVGTRKNGKRAAVATADISSLHIRKWDWLQFGTFLGMLAGLVVLAGVGSGCCS